MQASGAIGERQIPLVYYPDYRGANPYQDLLYRALRPAVAARPGTIDDALAAPPRGGVPLFHLHWDDELTRHHDEAHSLRLIRGFLTALERFRERGGRVIWTLHNLESNHGRNPEAFAELRARLVDLVDIVHLHSLAAHEAARDRIDLSAGKVRIVPHGHYGTVYPRFERQAARSELGLTDAGMVVVLPGRISGYKNADALIAAFLDAAGPLDRLAIVGFVAEKPGGAAPGRDPRIVVQDGFADPADLARWIAASDFVALPYQRSLTSGSAILAASLARGVLGTRTPGIADTVVDGVTGLVFEPGELGPAIRRALADGPAIWAARGEAAWRASRARDWDVIGQQWLDMLVRLVHGVPAGHRLEVVQ